MNLLVLGGTRFVGRAVVEAALARNHHVTLFNRGSRPDLFPETEQLIGDRDNGLDVLKDREWDAVVDTSGYVPRIVNQSVQLLKERVKHYTFISTVDVYDLTVPGVVDESHPTKRLEYDSLEDRYLAYGPLKARCEQVVLEHMKEKALIIRCGLVVGPEDHTDRFTYWPRRISEGGEILAPGNPEARVQFIDVRDIADWIIRQAEQVNGGVYTAAGPAEEMTIKQFLQSCAEKVGKEDVRFTWVDEPFLKEQEVGPWVEMPLWLPNEDEAIMRMNISKAKKHGLRLRPLEQTIADTLEWDQARPSSIQRKAGLASEKESKLLRLWEEKMGEGLN